MAANRSCGQRLARRRGSGGAGSGAPAVARQPLQRQAGRTGRQRQRENQLGGDERRAATSVAPRRARAATTSVAMARRRHRRLLGSGVGAVIRRRTDRPSTWSAIRRISTMRWSSYDEPWESGDWRLIGVPPLAYS
ncbi:hypothetical protein Syun_009950 [Stephania yunnanensis]|uniref:Uncharacterized protein n=1 Tax=Stephania yunnanensis TaxID=152371 RepID=A0AAP0KFG5_9MAGN